MSSYVRAIQNSLLSCIDRFRATSRTIQLGLLILLFIIGIKIILSFFPPLLTSDLMRSEWFGDSFWIFGIAVYDLSPFQMANITEPHHPFDVFDPISIVQNNPVRSWPNTPFTYPIIQLLFWAILSLLPFTPLTLVLAKLLLIISDLSVFFAIRKLDPGLSLISWIWLLISVPLTSLEGQTETITLLFFVIALLLHRHSNPLSYFVVGLGFQWKYVPILILPLLLASDFRRGKLNITRITLFLVPALLLCFPVLFGSQYIFAFFLSTDFPVISTNPFWIFLPRISTLFLIAFISLSLLHAIGIPFHGTLQSNISKSIHTSPNVRSILEISWGGSYSITDSLLVERLHYATMSFLGIAMLFYRNLMPWYWLWMFPLLVTINQKGKRRLFTVFYYFTCFVGLVDYVEVTVGWYWLLSVLLGMF